MDLPGQLTLSRLRSERKPVFWGLGRPTAVKMGVVHLDALIYACNESMSAANKALHTLSTWHRVSACMCSRGRPNQPAATSCRPQLALNSRRARLPQLFCIFRFYVSLAPHVHQMEYSFRRRRSHDGDYGVFDEHASVDCPAESIFSSSRRLTTQQSVRGFSYTHAFVMFAWLLFAATFVMDISGCAGVDQMLLQMTSEGH
jgi:hypothetical protein